MPNSEFLKPANTAAYQGHYAKQDGEKTTQLIRTQTAFGECIQGPQDDQPLPCSCPVDRTSISETRPLINSVQYK